MTPLIGKGVKTTKKSAATHHIQLKGHDARLCDSLEKNNKFKLHLKESLLIKRDKPELDRNIYRYPLQLFDCLLS